MTGGIKESHVSVCAVDFPHSDSVLNNTKQRLREMRERDRAERERDGGETGEKEE